MARRLHTDPEVYDEIEHARQILDESRGLGSELLKALDSTTTRILKAPETFPHHGRTRSGIEVRSAYLRRFRYRVIFVVRPDLIWVIAFMHEKQEPGYWRVRLETPPPE